MDRREFLASTVGMIGLAIIGQSRREFAEAADAPKPATASAVPDAHSAEARVILQFIQDHFGKKMMTAQHGGQRRVDYVTKTTGKTPAIWGIDLIRRKEDPKTLGFVKDTWKAGAIPTIMWHWGAPTLGDGFEQSKSKIEISKCFETGTPENLAMWVDLKSRADFLTQLRDAKIPVIWRPLHECSGGWFWWDKGGSDAFVKLWRTMHDYYTKDRKLDNLIWVLGMCGNPKPNFNPGADYYDIIGGDMYGGQQPWSHLYKSVKAIGPKGMPVTLHECGSPPDPDDALKQNALWSWFMVWDSYIEKVDKTLLTSVYNNDLSLTLDKLPNWKDLAEKLD